MRATRYEEIPKLCRVSKQVQHIAEAALYENLQLGDPALAYEACTALAAQNFARTSYVRMFYVWQGSRSRGPLPEAFWRLIKTVLSRMENLEELYLYDDSYSNSWIFDNPFPFKLREVTLFFQWDQRVVGFLDTQDRLKYLQLHTGNEDDGNSDLAQRISLTGNFPELVTLDGPLHVAFDLLNSPLKQLKLVLDDDNASLFESFLEAMALSSMNMHNFLVIAIPEFLVDDTLRFLGASNLATTLRHLGVFSLPLVDVCCHALTLAHMTFADGLLQRSDMHRSLLKFSRLEAIQLDVSHWNEAPLLPYIQRMLATELRTYCSTLRQLVFWHGHNQTIWRYDGEQWAHQHIPGPRYIIRDVLWREF